jgi:hypothetical protein
LAKELLRFFRDQATYRIGRPPRRNRDDKVNGSAWKLSNIFLSKSQYRME